MLVLSLPGPLSKYFVRTLVLLSVLRPAQLRSVPSPATCCMSYLDLYASGNVAEETPVQSFNSIT